MYNQNKIDKIKSNPFFMEEMSRLPNGDLKNLWIDLCVISIDAIDKMLEEQQISAVKY